MDKVQNPDPWEDLFAREERCQKTLRTLRKALLTRLLVAALVVWIAFSNAAQIWAWGLGAFVLVVDLSGTVVLWKEYCRQRHLLKELIAQEET